jgi:hypothetical protein
LACEHVDRGVPVAKCRQPAEMRQRMRQSRACCQSRACSTGYTTQRAHLSHSGSVPEM